MSTVYKPLISSALIMSSCFLNGEVKTEHLIGHYYNGLSVDGEPGLYFDDPKLGIVYLRYAVATGISKDYVVGCSDSCYILSAVATTAEAARRTQVTFPNEAAWKQEVFRLTGDSVKVESLL